MYNEGDKIQGYTICELITIGNNSVAYVATDAARRKVFFKMYQSPSIRVKWYRPFIDHQREMKARIEAGPCRQFCYQFLGGFEYNRKYHQVFEYLDKSYSLDKILERIRTHPTDVPWSSRELMAKVLVAGIAQLHNAGIVHADLKPDNIMLIDDRSIGMRYRLKIIDMDFSFFTDRTAPWHGFEGYFGTPGYMSPEHLQGKVPLPASDVFTLGLILYQLIGTGHPYHFEDNEAYLPAYQAYTAPVPKLVGIPTHPATVESVAEALHRCLHPDPTMRPSAVALHKILLGERLPPPSAGPPPAVPASTLYSLASGAPRSAPVFALDDPRRGADSRRLVLAGPGGAELSLGARLTVGRIVLISKFGEGGRYASDQQFILDKKADGWYIEPVANTPNATLLNGEVLIEPRKLTDGAVIGIGNAVSKRSKLDLRVQMR